MAVQDNDPGPLDRGQNFVDARDSTQKPNQVGLSSEPAVLDSGPGSASSATREGTATRPVFDNEKVVVVFVLGGPGAGEVFFAFVGTPFVFLRNVLFLFLSTTQIPLSSFAFAFCSSIIGSMDGRLLT
jgi:hypothetical protein